MWCEVADDPVVVSKSRPVKAGNSLEDKTAMMSDGVPASVGWPKASVIAKG